MKKLSSLSVFFPCFNEEKNIELQVQHALSIVPKLAKRFEIIIVNDGSVDKTKQIAQKLVRKYPELRLVSHQKNKGYGAALKTGFNQSQMEWIFFTDADLQFDMHELQSFIPFTDKYRAILGYRTRRAEGLRRALNARLLKLFVDIVFRVHVKDIDGAFKLLRADIVKPLRLESDGAFISSELLYKLKKNQVRFKQLPVSHYHRRWGNSTGANWRVIVKAMRDAILLYWHMKWQRVSHHQW